MSVSANTIIFTLHYQHEEYQVHTYDNAYYSPMTLISDYLQIPGFGLCCGMGSCGTCLVEIAQSVDSVRRPFLACGLQINDMLSNKHIYIKGGF